MKNLRRVTRKSYAMKRMASAIDRAIHAPTSAEKERSARWAAAWGLLCGINTNSSRLRSSELQPAPQLRNRRASDRAPAPPAKAVGPPDAGQIHIPPAPAAEHIAPATAARLPADSDGAAPALALPPDQPH